MGTLMLIVSFCMVGLGFLKLELPGLD